MFGVKGLRKFGGYIYILSLYWYLWKHRHQYDLIHIHMLGYPAFPGTLAGQRLGKRTIIKIANSGQGSDIRHMQENALLPGQRQMLSVTLGADRMVAINEAIVTELNQAGVAQKRIVVIPNGVETDKIEQKRAYRIDDTVTLVSMGRLHPQKGFDVLLPALKRIIHDRPDVGWRLWLLGDGPLRSELEIMAHHLGIDQQVKFWGKVNNVPTYLSQADIFVLPSRAEGMSNALLEAMAHGLPCVATQISGNVDLIQHGENGLLVPPDNEAALAKAIIHIVDDAVTRQQVGTRARQTVETNYDIEKVAGMYIALYNSLMQS